MCHCSTVSGAVFSYVFTHGLSAGASTSLFGLFGALVVYFYKHRELLGRVSQQQLINLGIILFINVLYGLSPNASAEGANWRDVAFASMLLNFAAAVGIARAQAEQSGDGNPHGGHGWHGSHLDNGASGGFSDGGGFSSGDAGGGGI